MLNLTQGTALLHVFFITDDGERNGTWAGWSKIPLLTGLGNGTALDSPPVTR